LKSHTGLGEINEGLNRKLIKVPHLHSRLTYHVRWLHMPVQSPEQETEVLSDHPRRSFRTCLRVADVQITEWDANHGRRGNCATKILRRTTLEEKP
jgi:hypothetical protein